MFVVATGDLSEEILTQIISLSPHILPRSKNIQFTLLILEKVYNVLVSP